MLSTLQMEAISFNPHEAPFFMWGKLRLQKIKKAVQDQITRMGKISVVPDSATQLAWLPYLKPLPCLGILHHPSSHSAQELREFSEPY